MPRRIQTRQPGCEPLERRRLLSVDPPLPVAMWIERDNGDDAYYQGIVSYATSAQPLAASKLLLRLADPASPDSSISQNFQLSPTSRLIATLLDLDATPYAGQVALIPDFTSNGHAWNWSPAGSSFTAEWQKAFTWAYEANTILAANGSRRTFISEVTFEAEASGIPADEPTLRQMRAYQQTLWPEFDASPRFVGTGLAHGYTNLAQMAGWTIGSTAADRLLEAAYCELYNMTEVAGGVTYVDAYAAGASVDNPSPAAPDTIYSEARNVADPVAAIFGTPSVDDPASTFGFFVGKHTSSGSGMPADLSRTYLIFSTEHVSEGEGLLDAFGTWDAPAAGPGAGVDEFVAFCRKFTDPTAQDGFMSFWGATAPPSICVFQYEFLPSTWVATDAGLPAPEPSLGDLVLWDYRECGTDAASLTKYHTWLLGYLADHPPGRLVLYVTDPAVAGNAFYDPTAAPAFDAQGRPTNFVAFLLRAAAVGRGPGNVRGTPSVPIEILIDRMSFPKPASGDDPTPVPAGWASLASDAPAELTLPADWTNLPRAFSWLTTLVTNTAVPAGLVSGLTIDPELTKGATGLTGDYAYQHVACWLDWAKRRLPTMTGLDIAMALEVDSSVFAKVNTMTFPAALAPDDGMPSLAGSWLDSDGSRFLDTTNPAAVHPFWRAPSVTDPILAMAYMETYVGGAPEAYSYYRWMNTVSGTTVTPQSPAAAAAGLQQSLLERPYAQGQGTISVQGLVATGSGTNFDELVQYDVISATAAPGSRWKVQDETPTNPTLVLGGSTANVTDSPWLFTELPMNWQSTVIQPGQEARITFVFSAEHDVAAGIPFFGYWTAANFLSFLGITQDLLAGTAPADAVFVTAVDGGGDPTAGAGVPATNYGLYSLRQICDAWGIAAYPDAMPPPAPGVSLLHDTGVSDTDRITRDGRLGLDLEAGARAEYSLDGGVTWRSRFVPRSGVNTVLVRQVDGADNVSPATAFTFALDVVAPPAVRPFLRHDSGSSPTDRITNDPRIAAAGRLPGATLEYSGDGGRTWAAVSPAREGRNAVRVRQVDVAGNRSSASPPLAFVLDTVALAPAAALANDTGSSRVDRITRDGRLAVWGREAGGRVEFSLDGGAVWRSLARPIAGQNLVQVRQVDQAGNASPSTSVAFLLDRTPPRVVSTAAPGLTGVGPGDSLDVSLSFSEPVIATGGPLVAVELGGQRRWAAYAAGSGGQTVRFRYAVRASDRLDRFALGSRFATPRGTALADVAGNPIGRVFAG